MRQYLGLALGPQITSQVVGEALFGLFLLISLLATWWIIRVGRPLFALYPRLARAVLWASAALLVDSTLMLLMLWIPVSAILQLGAMGWFILNAEDQTIHLYLVVMLPSLAGILLIGGVLVVRKLLQERHARQQ